MLPVISKPNGFREYPVVDAGVYGLPRALLKTGTFQLNETLGYALGALLNARLPRHVALWLRPSAPSAVSLGASHNRFGNLIEYFPDWRPLERGEAAARDREATGSAVALSLFDRHEWGEFGWAAGQVWFVDLERILPSLDAVHLLSLNNIERSEYLSAVGRSYALASESQVSEGIEIAGELNVLDHVGRAIDRLTRVTERSLLTSFDLRPYPLARLISRFAVGHLRRRLAIAARQLKLA